MDNEQTKCMMNSGRATIYSWSAASVFLDFTGGRVKQLLKTSTTEVGKDGGNWVH